MHNRQRHSPSCAPHRQRAKRQRQYRIHESLRPGAKQSAAAVDCIDPRNMPWLIPRPLHFFVPFFPCSSARGHPLPSPRSSPTPASSRAHFKPPRAAAVHIIVPLLSLLFRHHSFCPPSRSPEKPFGSRISHLGLSSLPAGVAANSSLHGSSSYLFVLRLRDLTILLSKPVSCACVVISIHARDILSTFPLCYPHGWTVYCCCCTRRNTATSSDGVFFSSSSCRLSRHNYFLSFFLSVFLIFLMY